MPIYEYRCNDCNNNFEVIQKITDPPVSSCSICRSGNTQRLISAASFSLKGSGWYKTDYNNTGDKNKDNGKQPETGEKDTKAKDTDKPKEQTKKNSENKDKTNAAA